ncbi:MAG TPA: 2-phospho-L-lactate transferase [Candidatus Acidoferrales bacterium]|nr:2-phospho-L-lactate transferase [Candidatus Acidoferrales bacterium]
MSGGTGGPKLLRGLLVIRPETQMTVVVNTGDDMWVSGNLVCPDVDTVIYTIAGVSTERCWGIRGDTFLTHDALKSRGHKEALKIGELDRATHIFRTSLLRRGATLTEATRQVCASLAIACSVLPMTNDFVPTMIETEGGKMHIQEFLIKRKQQPHVLQVHCGEGAMTTEVKTALKEHSTAVIGPSNPISSIGPILRVKGMREALKNHFVVAVSPILRTEPFSGPARKFMESEGLSVSSAGVAEFYSDFLDVLIVDNADFQISRRDLPGEIEVLRANTVMQSKDDRKELARQIVQILAEHS